MIFRNIFLAMRSGFDFVLYITADYTTNRPGLTRNYKSAERPPLPQRTPVNLFFALHNSALYDRYHYVSYN